MNKISVVITSYNRGSLLGLTLPTLFNQSIPKDQYEIIIVNDRSNDNTKEVFNLYKDKCNMRLITLKDYPKPPPDMDFQQHINKKGEFGGTDEVYRNCAVPKNIGWEHAKYDIIMFTDPEVFHFDDSIRWHQILQTAPLKHNYKYRHSVLAGYCYGKNEQPGRPQEKGFFEDMLKSDKKSDTVRTLARGHNLRIICEAYPFNIALQRAALKEINGWSEFFIGWGYEDNDVMNRLAFIGNNPMTFLDVIDCKEDRNYPRWVHLWHPTSRINNCKYNGEIAEKKLKDYRRKLALLKNPNNLSPEYMKFKEENLSSLKAYRIGNIPYEEA